MKHKLTKFNAISILLCLIITSFAFCSNPGSDISYVYGKYIGLFPAKIKTSDDGSQTQTPAFYCEIEITKENIIYTPFGKDNIIQAKYTSGDDTKDELQLNVDIKRKDQELKLTIKYDKALQTLTFTDPKSKTEIMLKKKDKFFEEKVEEYATFKLTTDLEKLTKQEKQMLPILIEVADIMDEICWKSLYKAKEDALKGIEDKSVKEFIKINYGPWDRLQNDIPFVKSAENVPPGANYYPYDITKEEFDAFEAKDKTSWYTSIRRDKEGKLFTEPYHVTYKDEMEKASELLMKAAKFADDDGLRKYLELRAEALLTDEYLESDLAWMDMQENTIDFVVGPIESYNDQFMGFKTSHSGQILIKDKEWSKKLARYASLLPALQESLPVADEYKTEKAHSNADMNAYDVVYYAGDCNVAGKNIAINLPNDPRVHAQKGSRKLQLKNAMQAKFDKMVIPIGDLLIDESQRKHIKFDAFFENTMFHEVAHGLGIKNTINGKGTAKDALKDTYSAIEEGKADILGLYIITKLQDMGEFADKDLMDNYVTFMAGIFRSVRFGASSAHGKANMIRFYYFEETGAFSKDEASGLYKVDFEKMKTAVSNLGQLLLTIQGDGDYKAAQKLINDKGFIREDLQNDLDKIKAAGIPKDIVFEQGVKALGL